MHLCGDWREHSDKPPSHIHPSHIHMHPSHMHPSHIHDSHIHESHIPLCGDSGEGSV